MKTTLSFQNITFAPKTQIIKNISSQITLNKMTALIGPSGSGKTTLLKILSGRFSQKYTGTIKINNSVYTPKMLKKVSGYVHQDDFHLPYLTVKETLDFYQKLRLKNIDLSLGLDMNTLNCNLSAGEKKRLSILIELIEKPDLLFLDEPTSGLDSLNAYELVRVLKELGGTVVAAVHQPSAEIFFMFDDVVVMDQGEILYCGRTVDVFGWFRRCGVVCPEYCNPADFVFINVLPSLRKVGECGLVECGDVNVVSTDEEIHYSEISEIVDIHSCQVECVTQNDNEDTHHAEISEIADISKQIKVDNDTENLVENEQVSNQPSGPAEETASCQYKEDKIIEEQTTFKNINDTNEKSTDQINKNVIDQINNNMDTKGDLKKGDVTKGDVTKGDLKKGDVTKLNEKKYTPFTNEFIILLKRNIKCVQRDRMRGISRLFQSLFIGLILSLIYKNTFNKPPQIKSQNLFGLLYIFSLNALFASSMSCLPDLYQTQEILSREYQNQYYRFSSYFLSKMLIDTLLNLIHPFLMIPLVYFFMNYNNGTICFFITVLACVLTCLIGHSLAVLVSSVCPSVGVASATLPSFLFPFTILNGMLVDNETLPWIFDILQYLSPTRYTLNILIKNEFRDIEIYGPGEKIKKWGVGIGASVCVMVVMYAVNMCCAFFFLKKRIMNKS